MRGSRKVYIDTTAVLYFRGSTSIHAAKSVATCPSALDFGSSLLLTMLRYRWTTAIDNRLDGAVEVFL